MLSGDVDLDLDGAPERAVTGARRRVGPCSPPGLAGVGCGGRAFFHGHGGGIWIGDVFQLALAFTAVTTGYVARVGSSQSAGGEGAFSATSPGLARGSVCLASKLLARPTESLASLLGSSHRTLSPRSLADLVLANTFPAVFLNTSI